MSEAVLDNALEQIADGLSVDWGAVDQAAPREPEWAKNLRILNDIVRLHREAAVDYEQTTLTAVRGESSALDPDTWGKYRLANKVGEGSYGSVYRAWDSELERDVALKILHRRVGDTRQKERLLQEGRALAKIRHNNVVNVLGVEAHGDRAGLCMEFVRGKTLAEIVRSQGRMSAAEAVLIGEDLCRALSAVHRAGYIHRDVKAKNVMRDDTGRIVLMDFGTGRTSEPQDGKSDRAGTPLYMAPEVLEGAQASARSDVYSLGVLLYHLVTGEYPVNARSIDELRAAHARRAHRWLSELRPDLPVPFMQVVERAIALDADERYPNVGELLAALSALKTTTHPILARVLTWAAIVSVVVIGMTTLGAMTSTHFNIALQRSEFANETVVDWLRWGRMTSFTPVLSLLVVLLAWTVLVVLRRLILAMSRRARSIDESVRRTAVRVGHRIRLDEVSVLASATLLVSALVVAVTWWAFTPLLLALFSYVSTAASSDLQILSPAFVEYHNRYRQVFSAVVLFTVAIWYPAFTLVRRGQSLHWGLIAGGLVVTCVAVSLLNFPYRMLYFNKSFEAVEWRGNHCYTIGERAGDVLLFCPEIPVPRLRTAMPHEISKQGIRESLFSRFKPDVYRGD